ncbi:MAG: hypothetical protein M1812_001753 [Candelaria pacifica]|nr:MAG: hypothetical protein M1812_001753 [Candelaria pacifica]
MNDAEVSLHPVDLRTLQPQDLQALPQNHAFGHDLHVLDAADTNIFQQRLRQEIGGPPNLNHGQPSAIFEPGHHAQIQNHHTGIVLHQQHGGSQFGILTPGPPLPSQPPLRHDSIAHLQHERDFSTHEDQTDTHTAGHIENAKLVPNPPNLQEWRQKLFNVDKPITLTAEEYQTYFPHVDNVYSHRSTQTYKRKQFVSHYWDCRLKGRPPGTPKSEDPNKKKRKRKARERDQCDVKIKITEYFPGALLLPNLDSAVPQAQLDAADANNFFAPGQPGAQNQSFGVGLPNGALALGSQSATSQRYYTIQRVNGNGGNGKGDGVAGPHKHSLESSDSLKKNSVQRHLLKEEKEKKKTQRSFTSAGYHFKKMSDSNQSEQKTYHKKATGNALSTVKKHSKDHDLKLLGSCFCPFVQRVWISLQFKGAEYQYVEIDPYKKPPALMRFNPRGTVPVLQHGNWGCYESTVIMEYLEDLNIGIPLLPQGNPQLRAHCRLWSDHINRRIIPLFYHCLQAQEIGKQAEAAKELDQEITPLVKAADSHGPYFLGSGLSFVDVQIAPWILRLSRVLKPYRGWPDPQVGSRWSLWVDAIENDEAVKSTTSTDDLYFESYERYAGMLGFSRLEFCDLWLTYL